MSTTTDDQSTENIRPKAGMAIPMHTLTRTDRAASEWGINDDVIRLREWGTRTSHSLPDPLVHEWTVGASQDCAIRLDDSSNRISRRHAYLLRSQSGWLLRDAGSKNGIHIDGARRREFPLEPGIEIGIGGVTLIAESLQSIALHRFLGRLLGWGVEQRRAVDQALRAIRMAAACRTALVICGEGDLVPTARAIHRRARGADRPFIVCDPRRQSGKATVRSPENYAVAREALVAAVGGSVCVRSLRLPADINQLIEALRGEKSQVQLIVCTDSEDTCELYRVKPIVIPPLAGRKAEIDRIIHEYAEDAMTELGMPRLAFLPEDHAWVREHGCASLPDIEKATLRLVALRAARSVSGAAARLGMAAVSLARWIGRRHMPMPIDD